MASLPPYGGSVGHVSSGHIHVSLTLSYLREKSMFAWRVATRSLRETRQLEEGDPGYCVQDLQLVCRNDTFSNPTAL